MSFIDGGDLASFAAIAESTAANKEVEVTIPSNEETSVSETDEQHKVIKQEATPDSQAQQTNEETQEQSVNTFTEVNTAEANQLTTELDDQQRTYANLQPIFLAMEMGQEAASTQEDTSSAPVTSEPSPQEQPQSETVETGFTPASATTITVEPTVSSSLALSQQQLISNLSNVVAASTEGGTPVCLASLLQDVVSGIQTSAGTVPAAIITDPSSSTGSFLIVNQNGVPIVRPVLVSSIADGNVGMGLPGTFQVLAQGGTEEGGDTDGGQEVAMDVSTAAETPVAQAVTDVETTVDIAAVNEAAAAHQSVTVAVGDGHGGDREEDNDAQEEAAIAVVSLTKTLPRAPTGKRKLSDGPRVCVECNKAFKYPSDLKKHLQIHTDIKKFKCNECGRFFRRQHQLHVHSRIHTGEKPYVCNRCGLAFRHDSTLTMHIRTRHDHLRPFKCEECNNTFGRLSHLKKHIKKVCGNKKNKEKPVVQCKFCDSTFPTKGDLRKHIATCEKKEAKVKAKEVTLHICDSCNKEFASPYNLRRHQLTHTDEKPFQCDICSRQFKEKSSLTKHMKRKHTGVDQGSQTEETGEQEYGGSVDVIAESVAASGVTMDTEDSLDGGASTVDTSSLIPGAVHHQGGEPGEVGHHSEQITEVVQGSGDVEMATVELATDTTHVETALQAAVEALVSASQQHIAAEAIEVHAEDAQHSTAKQIFEGVVPTAEDGGGSSLISTVVYTTVSDAEGKNQAPNMAGAAVVAEEGPPEAADGTVTFVHENGEQSSDLAIAVQEQQT